MIFSLNQTRYCERTNPTFSVGEVWTTLSYQGSRPSANQGAFLTCCPPPSSPVCVKCKQIESVEMTQAYFLPLSQSGWHIFTLKFSSMLLLLRNFDKVCCHPNPFAKVWMTTTSRVMPALGETPFWIAQLRV
jgi:hypothetical protein